MTPSRRLCAIRLAMLSVLVFPASSAFPVDLPANPPKPQLHRQADPEPATAGTVPTPESRPEPAMRPFQGPPVPETPVADGVLPDEMPAPEPNPHEKPKEPPPAVAAKPPPPPDPRSDDRPDPSGKLPADELACRARLVELGVSFSEMPAQSHPDGCSIPYPLKVKSLGGEIGLSPDAEMNCSMAEAAARFAAGVMKPAAERELGTTLKAINHASAYVCRPRNGTRKLSEHAFGNALDIGSFSLSDGRTLQVEATKDENVRKFFDAIRKAACGPFKTVLGPGSDADHALHFHLDLQPRRNGSTFCQ